MNSQTNKLGASDLRALLDDGDGRKVFVEAVIWCVERGLLLG